MIRSVTFENTTYAQLPDKFEPGTPNVGGAIGYGAALSYLAEVGIANVTEHETAPDQTCRTAARRYSRPAHPRKGQEQGGHHLLYDGLRPPARHWLRSSISTGSRSGRGTTVASRLWPD